MASSTSSLRSAHCCAGEMLCCALRECRRVSAQIGYQHQQGCSRTLGAMPARGDRRLGFASVLSHLGVMAALDAISAIVPGEKIHGVGYCLGGTLMAITLAWLAEQKQTDRIASATFLSPISPTSMPKENFCLPTIGAASIRWRTGCGRGSIPSAARFSTTRRPTV
mgnify:CR=1 FL=1